MIRGLLVVAAFVPAALVLAPTAAGDSTRTVDWRTVAPLSGRVVGDAVVISGTGSARRYPLVTIDRPGVVDRYTVDGRIRYAGVGGSGYLEMWSVFDDGVRYFTRTLATEGPLRSIAGSSGWRPFSLPFDAAGGRPARLEIALVLPGRGTVSIGTLRLHPLSTRTAWWSDRTAGVAGAVGGMALGLLGAFAGWATARGRARRLVGALYASCGVVGVVLIGATAVALVRSQPYAVWFPLLLGGALLTIVFGWAGLRARRTYADIELRRIRAMDA